MHSETVLILYESHIQEFPAAEAAGEGDASGDSDWDKLYQIQIL